MSTNFYLTEIMVKEKEKQLLKEASRLRLINAGKSAMTKNRKRISGSIAKFTRGIGGYLHRRPEPSNCRCPQG